MSLIELAELREHHPDLCAALDEAVRHFRAEAQKYRSQHHANKQKLDKAVRRSLAASNENTARVIEQHAAALRSIAATREGAGL